MVASFLATLFLITPIQQGDTATFRDAATAELYARARVRHVRQDSLVRDYRARVRTRLDFTAGRSRFSRQTALLAHETVAEVTWRAPNDLKVQVEGARSAAPILRMFAGISPELDEELDEDLRGDFKQEVWFDRPWFIPRSLGDSIRLMGLPEHAALHPLAAAGTDYYRFRITDSVSVSLPDREIRAVKMRVVPKGLGPSLVAGDMWIDRETADVVRLMVVFVGEYLWEEPDGTLPKDSAEARKGNERAGRFLSVEADIEYALVAQRYWLPQRQLLAITAEIPWFVNATLPARAVSTFTDYEVNTSPEVSFQVALDTTTEGRPRPKVRVKRTGESGERSRSQERYRYGYQRGGRWSDGRWEVDVPPADSLATYEWDSDFKIDLHEEEQERLSESIAGLADISEQLPRQWLGRRNFQLAWERFSDIVRHNRVQGLSVGAGFQVRPGPAFTTLLLTGRFAFGNLEPTGSAVWRRDGPAGRLDIKAYWNVWEVEPWTGGLGVGNSLNVVFTGHDDADYYRAAGGGFSYRWNAGVLRDVEFAVYLESQRSMPTEVSAPVPSLFGNGTLPPNRSIAEGEYLRGSLMHIGFVGVAEFRKAAELLANREQAAARFWTSAAIPFRVVQRTGTLTLRAGVVAGDSLPQLEFRLGGPQTVRGYTYGMKVGRRMWSVQLDFGLARSHLVTPVVFVDVGDTFTTKPLIGGGVGLSLINGLIRFSLSKGFADPSTDVRFDLAFRTAR